MSLDSFLSAQLDERRRLSRYRHRQCIESAQGPVVRRQGREVINFCSNDYLGLANHPAVCSAKKAAIEFYGAGSGASHLVCGHSQEHHALEQELAEFTGRERALLFSTGYMANLAIGQVLGVKSAAVFEDKLNHASLLDAGLGSHAEFQRYRHNDLQHLKQRLQTCTKEHKLILSDGVFSMDGDCAPITEIAALAKEHNAWFVVDDAHGLGVLGATGAGLLEVEALSQNDVPVLMGTLGKAFGSFGAFVAGSEALIESLIQFARTYIYTTALPPDVAAASRASLRLVREAHQGREHLSSLICRFRTGAKSLNLRLWASDTAIQPIILGTDQAALNASQALLDKGFWVSAIRPPTVPEGSARLRLTLTAAHSSEQVDALLMGLGELKVQGLFQ